MTRMGSSAVVAVAVVLIAGGVGFVTLHRPDLAIGALAVGALVAVALMSTRRVGQSFGIAVACLPFTQAPTLKLLFRWRVTEVIAWLTSPANIQTTLNKWRTLPGPMRVFVFGVGAYFAYTGLVGVVSTPFLEIANLGGVETTYHPMFRTVLETARGFAALSLVLMGLRCDPGTPIIERGLRAFTIGGAFSGLYALYQTIDMLFGLGLPVLPGTLGHEGYPRPFSTFYEPTALGSYCAAATLIGIGLLEKSGGRHRVSGVLIVAANLLGCGLSLSRIGVVGLTVGTVVTVSVLLVRRQVRWLVYLPIVALLGWVGFQLTDVLLHGLRIQLYSEFSLTEALSDRVISYQSLWHWLVSYPVGVGQGLWFFIGAGAPGLFRLTVEGGFVGIAFLLLIHGSVVWALFSLAWTRDLWLRRMLGWMVGAYASTVVTTLNYVNVTDAWMWFIWGVPALALAVTEPIGGGAYLAKHDYGDAQAAQMARGAGS